VSLADARQNQISSRSVLLSIERCGIDVRFVPSYDPKDFKAAIDENTKAIFIESIANPSYIIHDIEAIAKVRNGPTKMLLQVYHGQIIFPTFLNCKMRKNYAKTRCKFQDIDQLLR